MDSTNIEDEIIDLLQRRSEIIAFLQEGPREKRTMIDELGIARSTLDRAIRELEATDLVAYSQGKYALTPVGERLLSQYYSFVERIEVTTELAPFLQWTSRETFDIDLRLLAEADLWTPEPNDPYAMVNRHVDAIREAETFRAMLPVVGLHAMEMAHKRVLEDGARNELLVEANIVEMFHSDDDYAPLFNELSTCDRFTCIAYEGSIPFFVGIFDNETVQIGVDEGGEPRALLETDRSEVRTWAHKTIDEYEQQATSSTIVQSDTADV